MCASEEERVSTCLVCSMVGWQTLCTALMLKMGFALKANSHFEDKIIFFLFKLCNSLNFCFPSLLFNVLHAVMC